MLMVAWMGAGAASRGIQGACCRDKMQQVFLIDRRMWSYMGATNPWLLQPSMDCSQGGCRRADGRAECGKRGTSWGPNRNRFRKSATAAPSARCAPMALPSSIFDFVPGTSPSWSLKVWALRALHGRTPYSFFAPYDIYPGRVAGGLRPRGARGGARASATAGLGRHGLASGLRRRRRGEKKGTIMYISHTCM